MTTRTTTTTTTTTLEDYSTCLLVGVVSVPVLAVVVIPPCSIPTKAQSRRVAAMAVNHYEYLCRVVICRNYETFSTISIECTNLKDVQAVNYGT